MGRFLLLALLALSSGFAHPKSNGGSSPAAQMQSGRIGGSGGVRAADARHAPALDPHRKVAEQDCTKPVDPSAGNLKCK